MDTDMKDPTQQALVDTKKTAVLSDTPKQQGRRILAWPLGFATWLGGGGVCVGWAGTPA